MSGEGAQFGRYRLKERLGRGGMAEVWKARESGAAGVARTVVVKRILPHLAEEESFIKMFLAEARLSAKLNHPNIVHMYELGDVRGEYFLAMEYVRGRDFNAILRKQISRGQVSVPLGVAVVRDACRALSYAHALCDDDDQALRIVHRDVSPANLMVSFDGTVKLLDFGVAKALAEVTEERTSTGVLKGKLSYLSPEQVEGRDVDHRADIFACGIILHEAVTGRRLFKGLTDFKTLEMVRASDVPPPSSLNPSVPPEIDAICKKALARDRDDRYSDAGQMAAELDRVSRELGWSPERLAAAMNELFDEELHEPSITLTEEGAESLPRFRRRPRLLLAALGALALVAIGGGALLFRRHQPPPPPPLVVATPPPPAPPPPLTPPPSPATVDISVDTNPGGAALYVGSEAVPRGKTPLVLTVPRSQRSITLLARAIGFEDRTYPLSPDRDVRIELTLKKKHSHSHHSKDAALPKSIVNPFQ